MTNTIAGISGGRTSAMMALRFLMPDTVLCFQNTGLEHPKTYEFIRRLEDHAKREIVWLEWRPAADGASFPKEFRFERVTPESATYGMDLMRGMLRQLTEMRAKRGEHPVTPWARSRICTSYLKHRVQEQYVKEVLGWDSYTSYVGLRADEPTRVVSLRARETQRKAFDVPLYENGVTKNDVFAFWKTQPFDLEIQERQGNCTGCFLKDQADVSRQMLEPETLPEQWIDLENEFPMFGGRDKVPYKTLLEEAPFRLEVERRIRTNESTSGMATNKRMLNIIRQEERRVLDGSTGFSCSCETSMADGSDE